MVDLKCPFCGEKAVLETRRSAVVTGNISHIYCISRKCGADVWFYGCETDADEVKRRYNRRVNNTDAPVTAQN